MALLVCIAAFVFGCKGTKKDTAESAPAAEPATQVNEAPTFPLKLQRDAVGQTMKMKFLGVFTLNVREYFGEVRGRRDGRAAEMRGNLTFEIAKVLDNRLWSEAFLEFDVLETRETRGTGEWSRKAVRGIRYQLKRGTSMSLTRTDQEPVSELIRGVVTTLFDDQVDPLQPNLDDLFGRKDPIKSGQKWTVDAKAARREAGRKLMSFELGDATASDMSATLEDGGILRVAGSIRMPIKGLRGFPQYTGTLTNVLSFEAPVDPALPLRAETQKYIITARGRHPDGRQITANGELSRRFSDIQLVE